MKEADDYDVLTLPKAHEDQNGDAGVGDCHGERFPQRKVKGACHVVGKMSRHEEHGDNYCGPADAEPRAESEEQEADHKALQERLQHGYRPAAGKSREEWTELSDLTPDSEKDKGSEHREADTEKHLAGELFEAQEARRWTLFPPQHHQEDRAVDDNELHEVDAIADW